MKKTKKIGYKILFFTSIILCLIATLSYADVSIKPGRLGKYGGQCVEFSTTAPAGTGHYRFVTVGWSIKLSGGGNTINLYTDVTKPDTATDLYYYLPISSAYVSLYSSPFEGLPSLQNLAHNSSTFKNIVSGTFTVTLNARIAMVENGVINYKRDAYDSPHAINLANYVGGWPQAIKDALSPYPTGTYYDKSLTFNPEKLTGTITCYYFDLNSNTISQYTPAKSYDLINGKSQQQVSCKSIANWDYQYYLLNGTGSPIKSQSATVNLTTSNPDQEVWFYYQSSAVPGTITINYKDNRGNAITDPQTGHLKLPVSIDVPDVASAPIIDDAYLTQYKDHIDGYADPPTYSSPLPQLSVNQTSVSVNLVYSPPLLGNVTVKYLYQNDGSNAASVDNHPSESPGSHTYNSKTIPGATLIGANSQTITVVSGNSYTVTFYYAKDPTSGSVTVRYVDQATNSDIDTPDYHTNETAGLHTYNSKTEAGYTLQGASSQSQNVVAGQKYTLTFLYKKDATSGSVTVKYLNISDGTDVLPQDVFANETAGSHTYNAKLATGFSLSGASSQTITVVTGQSYTVIFNYLQDVPPPSTNIPPVAAFLMPDEWYEGNPVPIQNESYDLDGTIVSYNWMHFADVDGLGSNPNGSLTYNNVGTYDVELTVVDDGGASNWVLHSVNINPAIPKASINVSGTLKQNRKVIIASGGYSPSIKYPIITSQNEWSILPDAATLASGVTLSDIKYSVTSDDVTKYVLFKKPGTYTISHRVRNSKYISDWVTQSITIAPDLPPVASFNMVSKVYRDPTNNNKATVNIYDASYSSDDDIIANRTLEYRFDSNNDGNFNDESWQLFDNTNLTQWNVNLNAVGKYQFRLTVTEDYGQPTLPEFIGTNDKLKMDTSSFPVNQTTVEVDNIPPYVNFDALQKTNVELSIETDYTGSKLTNLQTAVNSFKASLETSGVNLTANVIDGSGENISTGVGGFATFFVGTSQTTGISSLYQYSTSAGLSSVIANINGNPYLVNGKIYYNGVGGFSSYDIATKTIVVLISSFNAPSGFSMDSTGSNVFWGTTSGKGQYYEYNIASKITTNLYTLGDNTNSCTYWGDKFVVSAENSYDSIVSLDLTNLWKGPITFVPMNGYCPGTPIVVNQLNGTVYYLDLYRQLKTKNLSTNVTGSITNPSWSFSTVFPSAMSITIDGTLYTIDNNRNVASVANGNTVSTNLGFTGYALFPDSCGGMYIQGYDSSTGWGSTTYRYVNASKGINTTITPGDTSIWSIPTVNGNGQGIGTFQYTDTSKVPINSNPDVDKYYMYIGDGTGNNFGSGLGNFYSMGGLTRSFANSLASNNYSIYTVTPDSNLDYVLPDSTVQNITLRQLVNSSALNSGIYDSGQYQSALDDIKLKCVLNTFAKSGVQVKNVGLEIATDSTGSNLTDLQAKLNAVKWNVAQKGVNLVTNIATETTTQIKVITAKDYINNGDGIVTLNANGTVTVSGGQDSVVDVSGLNNIVKIFDYSIPVVNGNHYYFAVTLTGDVYYWGWWCDTYPMGASTPNAAVKQSGGLYTLYFKTPIKLSGVKFSKMLGGSPYFITTTGNYGRIYGGMDTVGLNSAAFGYPIPSNITNAGMDSFNYFNLNATDNDIILACDSSNELYYYSVKWAAGGDTGVKGLAIADVYSRNDIFDFYISLSGNLTYLSGYRGNPPTLVALGSVPNYSNVNKIVIGLNSAYAIYNDGTVEKYNGNVISSYNISNWSLVTGVNNVINIKYQSYSDKWYATTSNNAVYDLSSPYNVFDFNNVGNMPSTEDNYFIGLSNGQGADLTQPYGQYYIWGGLSNTVKQKFVNNNYNMSFVTDPNNYDYLFTQTNQNTTIRQLTQASITPYSPNTDNLYGTGQLQTALDDIQTNISLKLPSLDAFTRYVLLNDTVNYSIYYGDYESDPQYALRWKYYHDPTTFENNQGIISDNATWVGEKDTFDHVGTYQVDLQAQDDPTNGDNRFNNYKYWSQSPATLSKIIVHRAPIAAFTVLLTPNAGKTQYTTQVINASYDLDHISYADKGIKSLSWKWKNITDTTWTAGSLPSSLPSNNDFLLSLAVTDYEGVTTVLTKPISTQNTLSVPTIDASPTSRAWANTNANTTITAMDTTNGIASIFYQWSTSSTMPVSGYTEVDFATPILNQTLNVNQSQEGIWYLHMIAVNIVGMANYKMEGTYKVDKTAPQLLSVSASSSYINGNDVWLANTQNTVITEKWTDSASGNNLIYAVTQKAGSLYSGINHDTTQAANWGSTNYYNKADFTGSSAARTLHSIPGETDVNFTFNSSTSPEVDYPLFVQASDFATNSSGYINSGLTIRIDNTAPSISIDVANGNIQANKVLNVTTSDSRSGVKETWYMWSNDNLAKGTLTGFTKLVGTQIPAPNVDGTYYLHIKTYDNVGNMNYSIYGGYTISSLTIAAVVTPNPAKQGQKITLTISTTGNAKFLTVYFPTEITSLDPSTPITVQVPEQPSRTDTITYYLPIKTPVTLDKNNSRVLPAYTLLVKAQKADGTTKTTNVLLDVKGSIFDGLKTEIKGN